MTSVHALTQPVLRRYLLGTASGAALIGSAPFAHADNTSFDHVYLDFGGQYSMWGGQHTIWAQPFFVNQERLSAHNGFDTFGSVTLQKGDWYLSLSADYGRTGSSRADFNLYHGYNKYHHVRKIGQAAGHESHLSIDFTLGKDVGLGMFGLEGSSIVSGGVRFQHFIGKTISNFHYYGKYSRANYYSTFFDRQLDRQFLGFGPVITWQARTPICPELDLTWGANAALVIGGRSFLIDNDRQRYKTMSVPEVGGYLGATWHMPDSPINITAGFAGNAYFSVLDAGYLFDDQKASRISYGPFVDVGAQL